MSIVTAELLVSPEAFADYRKVPFDETDFHAIKVLEVASAFVRSKTHQRISLATYTDQELRGTWDRKLYLPQRPVVSLEALSILECGWTTFTPLTDYTVTRRGLVVRYGGWGGPEATVRATYTAGHDEIPGDIAGVVFGVADRRYGDSDSRKRASETLGAFAYTNVVGPDGQLLQVTAEELATLESYKPVEWS